MAATTLRIAVAFGLTLAALPHVARAGDGNTSAATASAKANLDRSGRRTAHCQRKYGAWLALNATPRSVPKRASPGEESSLNPQPIPPGELRSLNPQPIPPGELRGLNPQPIPPREQRAFRC